MPESRSLSLAEDLANDRSYDLIEQAMMESARGRRFLAEFVRRHRGADTTMLLDAMSRLEQAVARDHFPSTSSDARAEGTNRPDPSHPPRATPIASSPEPKSMQRYEGWLGAVAPAARQAAADLVGEAESLQDTAWRLRESGAVAGLCAELDGCATRIYAACSSQEALARQMENAIEALRRLPAQTSARDARNDRAAASRQDQADDRYPASDAEHLRDLARRFRHNPAEFDAHNTPSLEDLDRLTIEERLALFS